MAELEHVPDKEAKQIENIIQLTIDQMRKRYPDGKPSLRGVHTKDHGCVTAIFKVREDLLEDLRIGVFANPGHEYQAWIRYSNAAVTITPDSPTGARGQVHGGRGMAVKLMGVSGTPLMPPHGPLTQDFVMVNHPVFPFANVEDYEALSDILLKDSDNADKADRFFERMQRKPSTDPVTVRAIRSFEIVTRIQSLSVGSTPKSGAYQAPPASPFDNQYFGAAPFLFGEDRVMKFSTKPVSPNTASPRSVTDPDYLRAAMRERLTAPGASDVVFEFQVQVRKASDLTSKIIDEEIEDVCFEWEEGKHPFVTVAKITIPPQDFTTPERMALCENLNFTPWHGIAEHRPLGGINRLRRGVYEASAGFRHMPKEPAHF